VTTFLLVPGACHGGWWYAPLVDALYERGHTGRAVTLSGLDPAAPQPPLEPITLDRTWTKQRPPFSGWRRRMGWSWWATATAGR
jgi:hypothetical protein